MKVFIKEFSVEQEIKTKGIELGILSPDGKRHIGDLIVTKTGVEWCKGKVHRGNGLQKSWNGLIALLESRP